MTPRFPPLLSGQAAEPGADPFEKARAMAALGCDGGTVVHGCDPEALRAAVVFAPEVALLQALAMWPICGIGLQNALGALAPPEVAVHLGWSGGVWVNGARCGGLRMAAAGRDPQAVPDWLVVGLEIPFRWAEAAPGRDPTRTVLAEEGCAGITPEALLESWTRHMLVWINRWSEAGNAPIHAQWLGLLRGVGDAAEAGGRRGTFLGLDADFGMLLRDGAATHLVPLTACLEEVT